MAVVMKLAMAVATVRLRMLFRDLPMEEISTSSMPVPFKMPPTPREPMMMATSSYILAKPPRLSREEMMALSHWMEKPVFI